jgi:hypothetical protein
MAHKISIDNGVATVEIDPAGDMGALNEAMDLWQDSMDEEQRQIAQDLGVSEETASSIQYLRTRSRWTQEKENELIARDKAGNPMDPDLVLSGEF